MQHGNDIRVTYLITTKNRGTYLEKTLANVREFIEPDDELVIIDGLSTDNTAEIVARHRDIVTIFVSEKDSGEAHAFNKGVFRARGKYIKPITDDDYFYPDAMRRLIAEMESNPYVDAIQCGGEVWKVENGQPVFVTFRFLPPDLTATAESIFDHASIGLGVIVRRSTMERTGGVSGNYTSVDGDLTCRLVECNCVVRYLDIDLYRWYMHPHSGFNKRKEFEKDRFLFDVRLGRWENVVRHDPEMLAEVTSVNVGPHLRALFQWIWIAGALSRSVLWRLSPIVFWLVHVVEAVSKKVRRTLSPMSVQQTTASRVETSEVHQWTGRLI